MWRESVHSRFSLALGNNGRSIDYGCQFGHRWYRTTCRAQAVPMSVHRRAAAALTYLIGGCDFGTDFGTAAAALWDIPAYMRRSNTYFCVK